jgi:cystathionine gamma-synthase
MTSTRDALGFETLAIHAGQEPEPITGSVTVPIYATSTYAQHEVGQPRQGYVYSRPKNPTRSALETCLAAVEGGEFGYAFASGMAATDTLLRAVCGPGDHVVLPNDVYGGTYRLFAKVLANWGVEFDAADISNVDAVRAAMRSQTRLIWCESPTNPMLSIADIAGLATLAHDEGAMLVVDNTFASPYLQQPLLLGADVVLHSTTKYLGGHSDVIGGGLVVNGSELAQRLAFHQNSMGAVASPFDSWLVLRGIKTLGPRMDRHCANARQVAELLDGHPAVASLYYPGHPEHPGHALAAKQMRDFGGMVSFTLRGGRQAALDVCRHTNVFTLAESLGGVESLIEHPAVMTHGSTAGSTFAPPEDLVRLSVGIETAADLLADLEQALDRLS